jgi:hypothetical protein
MGAWGSPRLHPGRGSDFGDRAVPSPSARRHRCRVPIARELGRGTQPSRQPQATRSVLRAHPRQLAVGDRSGVPEWTRLVQDLDHRAKRLADLLMTQGFRAGVRLAFSCCSVDTHVTLPAVTKPRRRSYRSTRRRPPTGCSASPRTLCSDRLLSTVRTVDVGGEACPRLRSPLRAGRGISDTYGSSGTTVTCPMAELQPGEPLIIGRSFRLPDGARR